ncbi:alginate lyase family protein [Streptomyces sp. NBC_00249]|uniref:alginate lyase family protein n=1 Tax=Streptomyces sp. NBC_00249 TaxID=2975690 RepID=UPI0022553786|nr:alginate lyase family protein [Streptomyces sp. NBC_00249]MCX5197165.1 alginate lyase family protein [Streptomyces sp. NBC_00249]
MRHGVPASLAALALGAALTAAPAPTPAPVPVPAAHAQSAPAAAAPTAFAHPGVLNSRAQLDFVRTKVRAGEQPWKQAFDAMLGSRYASLSRTPKPRAVVECGSYSNPDIGCSDEREDAIAAYTQALAWSVTGDARYARKSIELMDAWSATVKDHTNSNAPLQSGWAGSTWPRAAEIIKHTYGGGWPNQGRFAAMLRDVYLPEVIGGRPNSNGNWELIMMDAAVGISVHLDDRASYDKAMAVYLGRVPAYFYLSSDGPQPLYPPRSNIDTRSELIDYWHGQSTFTDGLAQETCRDFGHTGMGIAAALHVAETSRIQGRDLYPQFKDRFRHALGFHAGYELGEAVPSWLCGGSLTKGLGPATEVGYNALHTRLGVTMDKTRRLTEGRRPAGTENHFEAWETLTHAENPN